MLRPVVFLLIGILLTSAAEHGAPTVGPGVEGLAQTVGSVPPAPQRSVSSTDGDETAGGGSAQPGQVLGA